MLGLGQQLKMNGQKYANFKDTVKLLDKPERKSDVAAFNGN